MLLLLVLLGVVDADDVRTMLLARITVYLLADDAICTFKFDKLYNSGRVKTT